VLLTTRSKELRSHPGQTALPGGKVDESDAGVVEAAVSQSRSSFQPLRFSSPCSSSISGCIQYREANEEVALPLHSPHVRTLCTLEPVVSQHGVVVTPVVAYLDDVSVLEELRAAPGEVARMFDHPLEAVLDPELAREVEGLVPHGSEDWPYEEELYVRRFRASSMFFFFFSLFAFAVLSFAHPYLFYLARLSNVCSKC
jgi:peroxisomal coenzyme A diphosphatase NUDT7